MIEKSIPALQSLVKKLYNILKKFWAAKREIALLVEEEDDEGRSYRWTGWCD